MCNLYEGARCWHSNMAMYRTRGFFDQSCDIYMKYIILCILCTIYAYHNYVQDMEWLKPSPRVSRLGWRCLCPADYCFSYGSTYSFSNSLPPFLENDSDYVIGNDVVFRTRLFISLNGLCQVPCSWQQRGNSRFFPPWFSWKGNKMAYFFLSYSNMVCMYGIWVEQISII